MTRIGLLFSIPLLAGSLAAQNEATTTPAPIAVKWVEPIHALVLPMAGTYAQHEAAFGRLSGWLRSQAILPTGPAFGRYFNDASQDQTPLWQVGLPVPDGVTPPAPFEGIYLPAHRVASLVHRGPYEEAARQWPLLIGWVFAHGYRIAGAATQVYLDDAGAGSAKAPRTELRLPIENVN